MKQLSRRHRLIGEGETRNMRYGSLYLKDAFQIGVLFLPEPLSGEL
jgi:hypothetical protein